MLQTPGLSSWSDSVLRRVFPDASTAGDTKSRLIDSSRSPSYRIRTESEQVALYSPEHSSLHESEGLLLLSLYLLQFYFLLAPFTIPCLSMVPLNVDGNHLTTKCVVTSPVMIQIVSFTLQLCPRFMLLSFMTSHLMKG